MLSAKQWKALCLPSLPTFSFFFCIELRCVEALTNDCHQSKEVTAQQRMCSANGRAAYARKHKQEGSWNPAYMSPLNLSTSSYCQGVWWPLMQSCSLTHYLWSMALGCQKQQAIITSFPVMHSGLISEDALTLHELEDPLQIWAVFKGVGFVVLLARQNRKWKLWHFNSHVVQFSWYMWLLSVFSCSSPYLATILVFLWYTDIICAWQKVLPAVTLNHIFSS